jgi:hypothetical protein
MKKHLLIVAVAASMFAISAYAELTDFQTQLAKTAGDQFGTQVFTEIKHRGLNGEPCQPDTQKLQQAAMDYFTNYAANIGIPTADLPQWIAIACKEGADRINTLIKLTVATMSAPTAAK